VTFERENSSPPGLFRPDSRVIQLGLDAFERAVGRRPILVRSGGTLPIVPALVEKGIDTIVSGFALPESNVHSPNERLRVEDLERSIAAAQALYTEFANLR
jgi:acetylornithine deacetylase/succinyl-diaminopimelate desuccinylase-like protein